MKKLILIFLIVIPFVSIKGDVEWVKTNGPFGGIPSAYCITKERLFICIGQNQIYYSTDDGLNWDLTGTIPVKSKFNVGSFKVDNQSRVFFSDNYSIYLYDQTSNNWNNLNLKLDSTAENSRKDMFALKDSIYISIIDKGLYKLSVDLSSCSLVYSYNISSPLKNYSKVSCNTNNTFFAEFESGIAYSKNNGLSWDSLKIYKNVKKHLTNYGDVYCSDKNIYRLNTSTFDWDTIFKPDSFKIFRQYLSSDNLGNIYYVDDDPHQLYKSSDNGKSWELFKKANICNDEIWLTCPSDVTIINNKVYINDQRSLWFSRDNGSKWRRIDFPVFPFYKTKITLIYPLDDNRLFILSELGLFRTLNKGMNYQSSFLQCSTDYFGFDKILYRGGKIYGTVFNNNFMSADVGDTWTLDKWLFGYKRSFDANNNGTLYYSSFYGFRKTNNWGITFDTIDSNLPKDKETANVRVTGVCVNDNHEILISLYNGGIYKSKDDGKTWIQKFDTNFVTYSFYRSGDCVSFYSKNKLVKSTNYGETWKIEDSKLPLYLRDYYVAPNGYHYVNLVDTIDAGIYQSIDGGSNWEKLSINFNSKLITAFAITPDNTMWVGTDSGYVYHTTTPIVSVREFNSGNSFLIAPNPATDYIEIKIPVGVQLAVPMQVEIYNIFGLKVWESSDDSKSSDDLIRLDVSGFVPGVYFVKIGDRIRKFIKI